MTTTNYKNYTLNDLNNTPWFSTERQLFTDILNKLPAADTSHVQAEHIHSSLTQPNNDNVVVSIGTDGSMSMPLQAQGFLQVTAGGKIVSSSGVGGGGILDTSAFTAGDGTAFYNQVVDRVYMKTANSHYPVEITGVNAGQIDTSGPLNYLVKYGNSFHASQIRDDGTSIDATTAGTIGFETTAGDVTLKSVNDVVLESNSAGQVRIISAAATWTGFGYLGEFGGTDFSLRSDPNVPITIVTDNSSSCNMTAGSFKIQSIGQFATGTIDMTAAYDDADITLQTSGSNSQIILRTQGSSNIVLDSNQEMDLLASYIYLGDANEGLFQTVTGGINLNGDSTLGLTGTALVNVSAPKGLNITSTGTGTVNFTSNTGNINIKALTSGSIDIETASGNGTLQCTGTMLIQTTGGDFSMHCPVGNTLNITKDDGMGHVGQFGMDANAVYITSQCGTGDLYILADGLADFHAGSYKLYNISIYADNTAAISGGLSAGMLYRDGSNPDHLCIVH